MKLIDEQKEKIEKAIDRYIKKFDEKDKEGKIIGNRLENNHESLLDFYQQSFFLKLTKDEERFYAKMYFKSKLPYKAYRDRVSKDPMELVRDIEDFEEMYNPKYSRKTERRKRE